MCRFLLGEFLLTLSETVNAIGMRSTIMLVFVGNAFCFLSSLLRLALVLFCLFVASFPNSVLCSLTGFFPEIILNKCEQILFLLGFSVFNAVNDAIILHWHLLHSSLSKGNKFLGLYTGKK